MWIVLMGIEHERIHFETSAAIIRQLPFEEICSSQQFMDCPYFTTKEEEIPNNQLKLVPSYAEDLHLSVKNAEVYGWDNEFGEKSVSVKEFQASSMLVSNFQFLEFVRAGGYQNYNYWDEQGISWLKSVKPKKPLFWLTENGTYFLRTMNKVMPLPLDWPAEVNNLEATAFCKWKSEKLHKSLRLPTEDEYFAIRALLKKDELDWKHGEVGNINLQYWFSPNPVNMFPTGEFYDIVGNVWQHCCTPIYPFENFQIHPVYEDFTTPTFDGRHFMIKGGSFASTGNEALKRSRYAFRRHFHQFAGFRFVESSNPVISAELIDQTDGTVERFLKLHYQQEKSYVNKVAKIVRETCCDENEKCLTVGCSVGRIVIEMSKCFKESFGTDYSARFFQMATRILEKGELKYKDIEIYVEDFEVDKRKLILYQMNPENPDPKKLNGFRVMILDGLAIRKGTIHKVIAAMKAVIEKEAYVLIVSSSDTNSISAQQLKEIIGAVEVVQSISTLTSQS